MALLPLRPAAAQRQPGDAAVWQTHVATVAARRDGWIELRAPDAITTPLAADPHDWEERDGPDHLRVTPEAADRWREAVATMLSASASGGAAFWSRAENGRVTTPELAPPGRPYGVSLVWNHRGGKVAIDGNRATCEGGHSLQDLSPDDVRGFLAALARASAAARRARPTPATVDTARPYLPGALECRAHAYRTPGLPPLPPDPRRPAEVLVSLTVDRRGLIDARSLRIAPAVDAVTDAAIRRGLALWRFEPAQLAGAAVPAREHLVLAFAPQPPLARPPVPQADHPTFTWTVGRDRGWVVVRPRPDWRGDTLFTGRRPDRMSLAPREVSRWLAALNPFWRRAEAWRQPAPYADALSGPGIGPPDARLRPVRQGTGNGAALGMQVGQDGERLDWTQVRQLTSMLAREATAALAAPAPAPVLDTAGVYAEVAVDRAAVPSDSNVAEVAAPGGDGEHDEVLLRFVVDRHGLVEPGTVTAVDARSPVAARAAIRLASQWDYAPAVFAGRSVRQWAHATVRVVAPGQAAPHPPRASPAARLAARDGCEMTRGPVSADYSTGEFAAYQRALSPSVEFRCEIAPSLPAYRVVLHADTTGSWTRMDIFAAGRAKAVQSVDIQSTDTPMPGMDFLQARDLDGDGYRDLMLNDWWGTGGIGYTVWRFRPTRGVFVSDAQASRMNGISPVPGEPCVTDGGGNALEKYCLSGERWRLAWTERWTKTSTPGTCLVTRRAKRGGREVVLQRRYERDAC